MEAERWIVRTLHAAPNRPDEWIECPTPYMNPFDAEWKAEAMMIDFPGVVIDYVIEREHTIRTVWGRYGDEHDRG